MAVVEVVDTHNKKVGEIDISDDVLGLPFRPYILTEVVNWQRASWRAGTHSALTKAEVSGTNKKPFPQKGRGMARQGSLRNPHYVGGGVTFAPKPRDYSYTLPKAKRRIALATILSQRLRENGLKVMRDFSLTDAKTREVGTVLKALSCGKTLIVDKKNEILKRCVRNMATAKYVEDSGLNVYDILAHPNLVMTEGALRDIEQRLLGT